MRNDNEKIMDILDAINKIEKHFDQIRFQHDEIYRYGLLNILSIVGEASRALSEEFKQKSNFIDWYKVIGFRNKVTHQYFEIDWDIVLEIIEDHIPILKHNIEILLSNINDPKN